MRNELSNSAPSKTINMPKYLGIFCLLILCNSCQQSELDQSITYSYLIEDKLNVDTELIKIRYQSGPFEVPGFIIKPKKITESLPVIIFCRGGNNDFGSISQRLLTHLMDFSLKGYVILASQYRGGIWSEGIDEFGGDEIEDVLKLIEVAEELEYADSDRIGIIGSSRGGMMAYIAAQKSDEIDVLVVQAGPVDLFKEGVFRQSMYENVFLPIFGDSIIHRDEYIKRSAAFWPEKIKQPILIIHGTNDDRVSFESSQVFARELSRSNENVDTLWFENTGHNIFLKSKEPTMEYMDKYLK